VAINYGANANVFVTDYDTGTVRYIYTSNGTTWNPMNLGSPAEPVLSSPAVINYPAGTAAPHENVWVIGGDNNGETIIDPQLYLEAWNGNTWLPWAAAQSPPPGVKLSTNTPVVNNYQAGNALDEDVFVSATNGDLYEYHWNGALPWQWINLGTPAPGVSYSNIPAVINYAGSGGTTRENVFVTGSDGNLYVANGANFTSWTNEGHPPGVAIANTPAAINYTLTNGTVTENVFVTGTNGELYDFRWNGTTWAWAKPMGFPAPGVTISDSESIAPLVAINNQSGNSLHEHVFVAGSDGNMYNDFWNGTTWAWSTVGYGTPPGSGATIDDPIGVVNFQVGNTLEMDVFAVGYIAAPSGQFGGTDTLYLDYWNGSNWIWTTPGPTGW
jgi:hypothetical protein